MFKNVRTNLKKTLESSIMLKIECKFLKKKYDRPTFFVVDEGHVHVYPTSDSLRISPSSELVYRYKTLDKF